MQTKLNQGIRFTSSVRTLCCASMIFSTGSERRNLATASGSLESLPSTKASLKELTSGVFSFTAQLHVLVPL